MNLKRKQEKKIIIFGVQIQVGRKKRGGKMNMIIEKIFKYLYKNPDTKVTNVLAHFLGLTDKQTLKIMEKGEESKLFFANKIADDIKLWEWNLTAVAEGYWENKLNSPINQFEEHTKELRDFINENIDEFLSVKQEVDLHENFKNATSEIYGDKLKLVKEFFNIQPVYYDSSKNFWMWNSDNFCWVLVDETDLVNLINQLTGANTINSRVKAEIMEGLRQIGRRYKPLESKKTWVQFKELIYDIQSGKTFKASSKYFVTNPVPWQMGNSDETPVMDKIFKEWVGEKYVKTLYEILAYCLIPDYPVHRIFCFFGGGANGKSKYMDLLRKFVGIKNCCSASLDNLFQSRFGITKLHKKLACQMGETNFNEMKKTSVLKSLSGGDLIGFEYKNKTPFEDKNYAKILISTNNLPTTTDKTIGFYRRWLIIDFFNTFDETKEILNDIPEIEYSNLANKSIGILKRLLKERKFSEEGSIELRKKRFEDKSNPLGKFFKENLKEDYGKYIFKFEFKKRLDEWCKENHFREISDFSITKYMKEHHYPVIQRIAEWHTGDGKKPILRAWNGINWK